mmetsp:Transcript_13922/g.43844  ORF Transcript_13922/g.43844 Transcript_13922/m.43844 type:complete len:203 (-) Transcript_13922:1832-2440(-)
MRGTCREHFAKKVEPAEVTVPVFASHLKVPILPIRVSTLFTICSFLSPVNFPRSAMPTCTAWQVASSLNSLVVLVSPFVSVAPTRPTVAKAYSRVACPTLARVPIISAPSLPIVWALPTKRLLRCLVAIPWAVLTPFGLATTVRGRLPRCALTMSTFATSCRAASAVASGMAQSSTRTKRRERFSCCRRTWRSCATRPFASM